jgi:hypothetical protein
VDGLYCIPSHENYPADAQDHLAAAVNFVNNVEILDVIDDSSAGHKDFGVLDPLSASVGRGESGVGMRVTMSTADGKNLADFVIGDEVKGGAGQRYVRRADKQQVYTVKIDPSKLSTKFEDWIERDLLKLDPSDISKVAINDYSAVVQRQLVFGAGGPQIALATDLDMKSSIDLAYDQKDFKWKLDQLVTFADDNKPKVEKLADNEELNTSKLNDLKFALDDLEIVDVRRKAKGLGENLQKAVMENPGAIGDLEQRGFFFQQVKGPDGKPQFVLLSNNGEINIGLKTGVEYVLRFGDVAGADKSADEDQETADDQQPTGEDPQEQPSDDGQDDSQEDASDEKQDSEETKVLRYLFVMTQTNPSLIEQPELADVPPEEPPADELQETPSDAAAAGGEEAAAGDSEGEEASVDKDDAAAGEGTEASEAAGEGEQADDKEAEEKEAEDPARKLEEWKQKRDAIIKENERKQKEFDEKVEIAQQRVKELNERFADWYYVINDETYQKIHLGRDDIIKEKEKSEDEKKNAGGADTPKGEKAEPKDDLETFDEIKKSLDEPTDD